MSDFYKRLRELQLNPDKVSEGRTIFVDGKTKKKQRDGSFKNPYKTVQEAFAPTPPQQQEGE